MANITIYYKVTNPSREYFNRVLALVQYTDEGAILQEKPGVTEYYQDEEILLQEAPRPEPESLASWAKCHVLEKAQAYGVGALLNQK